MGEVVESFPILNRYSMSLSILLYLLHTLSFVPSMYLRSMDLMKFAT